MKHLGTILTLNTNILLVNIVKTKMNINNKTKMLGICIQRAINNIDVIFRCVTVLNN